MEIKSVIDGEVSALNRGEPVRQGEFIARVHRAQKERAKQNRREAAARKIALASMKKTLATWKVVEERRAAAQEIAAEIVKLDDLPKDNAYIDYDRIQRERDALMRKFDGGKELQQAIDEHARASEVAIADAREWHAAASRADTDSAYADLQRDNVGELLIDAPGIHSAELSALVELLR